MQGRNECASDLKVILVGDERSGKTCLLKRLVENRFCEKYTPTLFDEFNSVIKVNVGKREYKLDIAELGGNEEFKTYRQTGYEDGDVIAICFSVVRPRDVLNIGETWLPEIQKYNPNAYILLVGTQVDLRENKTVVRDLAGMGLNPITEEKGLELVELMQMYNVSGYVECSAFNKEGVLNVFEEVIKVTEPEVVKSHYNPSRLNQSFRRIRKETPKLVRKIHKCKFSLFKRFRSRQNRE